MLHRIAGKLIVNSSYIRTISIDDINTSLEASVRLENSFFHRETLTFSDYIKGSFLRA